MTPPEITEWIMAESEKARLMVINDQLPKDIRTYQNARLSTLNEILRIMLNSHPAPVSPN